MHIKFFIVPFVKGCATIKIKGNQNVHRIAVAHNPFTTALINTGSGSGTNMVSIVFNNMIEFWIEIIAHTSLFLLFLPIFYFYYVAPLQSYALIDDIFDIIQPELVDMTLLSNLNDTRNLNKVIDLLNSNLSENQTISNAANDIKNTNAKIFQNTNAIFYTLGCVLFASSIGLSVYYNISLVELALSSIIVLIFIIINEFAIVGLFFKNFKEIDSNFVKAIFISNFLRGTPIPAIVGDMNFTRCNFTVQYFQRVLPPSILRLFT